MMSRSHLERPKAQGLNHLERASLMLMVPGLGRLGGSAQVGLLTGATTRDLSMELGLLTACH